MSESGFMLQFTKIKEEEKEEKCVYLACSQRLNYPDRRSGVSSVVSHRRNMFETLLYRALNFID